MEDWLPESDRQPFGLDRSKPANVFNGPDRHSWLTRFFAWLAFKA